MVSGACIVTRAMVYQSIALQASKILFELMALIRRRPENQMSRLSVESTLYGLFTPQTSEHDSGELHHPALTQSGCESGEIHP